MGGYDVEERVQEWLLSLERRVTQLETRSEEARLRHMDVSLWKLALLSTGTAFILFVLKLIAAAAGWM